MNRFNRTVIAPLSSAIIAVLIAGLIVISVDSGERQLRQGEARVAANGMVEVSVAGAPFERVPTHRVLGRNDRIRVTEGTAVLELPGSASAELRAGSAVTLGAAGGAVMLLEAGDLLVLAGRRTVIVDGGTAQVSVAGSAKLRRAASLAAGVYQGNLLFHRNEQSLAVPAYRQAVVAGTGLLPPSPQPLELRATDAWDVRMLGEVLEIDEHLRRLGRDFEEKLPAGRTQSPQLYRAVVPALAEAPITPQLLTGRAPAENLIGLVLVSLDRGEFATRVRQVFGFRSEGASWGLVAADRELNPNPVIGNMEAALGALGPPSPAPLTPAIERLLGGIVSDRGVTGGTPSEPGRGRDVVAAPGPERPDRSGGTAPGQTPPGGTPSPSPSPSPSPGPDPGEPAPPPPPPQWVEVPETGTILDSLLQPVVDPLETLLSGLLEGLLGSPADTTTTTTTTAPPADDGLVGGVVKGVGGLLGG